MMAPTLSMIALAVGRRRQCLVDVGTGGMSFINGYKLMLLRGSVSSFSFFLSVHLIKASPRPAIILPLPSQLHITQTYPRPHHQHGDRLLPIPTDHHPARASPRQAASTTATVHSPSHPQPFCIQPIFRFATRASRECHNRRRPLLIGVQQLCRQRLRQLHLRSHERRSPRLHERSPLPDLQPNPPGSECG